MMKFSTGILPLVVSLVLVAGVVSGEEAGGFLNQGIEKGRKGDLNGALADFNKAIELNPDLAVAYNERGLAKGGLAGKGGHPDISLANALGDYNKAIALKPDLVPAYYNRGVVLQALGNEEGARADFTRVVEFKPEAILMAQAYLHLGDLSRGSADKHGEALLYANAYFYRGVAQGNGGNTNGALADLNKAIILNPAFAQAYYNRAVVEHNIGKLAASVTDFDRVIKLDATNVHAYNNRGMVKGEMEDWDGALADYSKSIELNPINIIAFINRAVIKRKKGDLEGALADENEAAALNAKTSKTGYFTEINRKTFSLSLPGQWTEKIKDDMYNPDGFVFFEGPESAIFSVIIGRKSAGASAATLVKSERDASLKKFTDTTISSMAKWSGFDGQGFIIEGKFQGIFDSRITIFGFENDQSVCVIEEFAALVDYQKYASDFDVIRQTFRLK